jgi:hypothetical protein
MLAIILTLVFVLQKLGGAITWDWWICFLPLMIQCVWWAFWLILITLVEVSG